MSTRAVSLLCVLAITALGVGCEHAHVRTDAERARSLKVLATARIAGSRLDLFLQRRTAVLISGNMIVSSARANGQTLTVGFDGDPNTVLEGPAQAVAVASDGYFLTAAHCLHAGHVNYLVYTDGSRARIAMARTVFEDQNMATGRDCAILHVDAELPYVFEWCGAKDLVSGAAVVAVGHSDLSIVSDCARRFSQECFAGSMLGIRRLPTDYLEVRSQLPVRKGDSGGPVATVEGKLIAVHSQAHAGPFSSYTSVSLRPDLAWVGRIIQNDRAHRPAARQRSIVEAWPDTNRPPILVISLCDELEKDVRGGTKAN